MIATQIAEDSTCQSDLVKARRLGRELRVGLVPQWYLCFAAFGMWILGRGMEEAC